MGREVWWAVVLASGASRQYRMRRVGAVCDCALGECGSRVGKREGRHDNNEDRTDVFVCKKFIPAAATLTEQQLYRH